MRFWLGCCCGGPCATLGCMEEFWVLGGTPGSGIGELVVDLDGFSKACVNRVYCLTSGDSCIWFYNGVCCATILGHPCTASCISAIDGDLNLVLRYQTTSPVGWYLFVSHDSGNPLGEFGPVDMEDISCDPVLLTFPASSWTGTSPAPTVDAVVTQ